MSDSEENDFLSADEGDEEKDRSSAVNAHSHDDSQVQYSTKNRKHGSNYVKLSVLPNAQVCEIAGENANPDPSVASDDEITANSTDSIIDIQSNLSEESKLIDRVHSEHQAQGCPEMLPQGHSEDTHVNEQPPSSEIDQQAVFDQSTDEHATIVCNDESSATDKPIFGEMKFPNPEQVQQVVCTDHTLAMESNAEEPAPSSPSKITSLLDKLDGSSTSPSGQHDELEENVLEKLSQAGTKKLGSGWSSWTSWGTSILSTATKSLHTFTDQVSEGMHTVAETLDEVAGVNPADSLSEDLSTYIKEPVEVIDRQPVSEPVADGSDTNLVTKEVSAAEPDADWFASWGVQSLTDALSHKTKIFVESGLDVLETIGKKTMETIQDKDPGLKKTRTLLKGNKASLSQILREAKLESENSDSTNLRHHLISYSALFDEYQGFSHLEALEMLSVSCLADLNGIEGEDCSAQVRKQLDAVAEDFSQVSLSDDDADDDLDFVAGFNAACMRLELTVKSDKILAVQKHSREWIQTCQADQAAGQRKDARLIHDAALKSFAELSSCAMELFHKAGELTALAAKGDKPLDPKNLSNVFICIAKLLCSEITQQSTMFNQCLDTAADDSEEPDNINPMITNVFLEASNSKSYIQDSIKLLQPVVQKYILECNSSGA